MDKASHMKGEMGIGALIIFIAMILVASLAASVLLSSGGSMQQKALVTGSQTEERVTSGLEAMGVVGSDASQTDPLGTPHRVGDFKIMVRTKSGSETFNFNKTIITIDTQRGSNQRYYGGTVGREATTTSTQFFTVYYVSRGPGSQDDYLGRGDVAKIILRIPQEIGENEKASIRIMPQSGQYTQIDFYAPDSMLRQETTLWPT